ncbi:hypothetical protein [Pseudoroseomonas cervicalis]|uniref:hypothetical protein n=1 Tax=Teichococcus cervicalis TaxID=204525 RepID=UPI002784E36A|nr:hypothetical protein [Pseudoroseomonas cervicalis]MDQ1081487.1 hypothetical protein [Pseudoroseomonas cervicalis]
MTPAPIPPDPILLVGGSGAVGRWTARHLRQAHPDLPILLGGRDLARARDAAAAIGGAEAVAVDLAAADLGLGGRAVGAVAVLFADPRLATLRFAQARGVPHLSISLGLFEIGPEIALHTHRPQASAVVLGTEWLVGATTLPVLRLAQRFGRLERVMIGALLDEQDGAGPAGDADFSRQNAVMPAALYRRDGAFAWHHGEALETSFRAADGTEVAAMAFSVNDVIGLAAATGVPDLDFRLAIGTSSSRRRGGPASTEIILELEGEDPQGRPLRSRHAVIHPEGQMPLTGLGVALLLERLAGLDGRPATPPGLYLPYQLLEPERYFARFDAIGGQLVDLGAA